MRSQIGFVFYLIRTFLSSFVTHFALWFVKYLSMRFIRDKKNIYLRDFTSHASDFYWPLWGMNWRSETNKTDFWYMENQFEIFRVLRDQLHSFLG